MEHTYDNVHRHSGNTQGSGVGLPMADNVHDVAVLGLYVTTPMDLHREPRAMCS